jgi:hypothetical protein
MNDKPKPRRPGAIKPLRPNLQLAQLKTHFNAMKPAEQTEYAYAYARFMAKTLEHLSAADLHQPGDENG